MKQYVAAYANFIICSKGRIIEFVNNRCVAKDEVEVQIIENNSGFGKYIFPADVVTQEMDDPGVEPPVNPPTDPPADPPVGPPADPQVDPPADPPVDPPAEPEIFVCEECGAEFASAQALNGHMISHRRKK